MTVKLDFYTVDNVTGTKKKINNIYDFQDIFKGNQAKVKMTIFNSGDTPAVKPVISVKPYEDDYGTDYSECVKWKKLSFMENSNFQDALALPDIQPNAWLTGKDVYSEDFQSYPVVAGTKPDMSWQLWSGIDTAWEVYNGWLQHNVDNQDGKARWTTLPAAKDFTYSMRVTVRDSTYGGLLIRDVGDMDTGYIILIQGMEERLGNVASNEGRIQIYKGTFMNGIDSWQLLGESGSIGIRGTHDYFKVVAEGDTLKFWYQNEDSASPIYTFTDPDSTYTRASIPIILCSAGSGSVLSYFDDIYMEVTNDDGAIWIQNAVDADTPLFNKQYSLLDVKCGGVL